MNALKILKVRSQQSCNGCELCVFEAQRQLQKVGLEGSLVRIFKNKSEENKRLEFYVELDPHIHSLDVEKICNICPKQVFEISEEEADGFTI